MSYMVNPSKRGGNQNLKYGEKNYLPGEKIPDNLVTPERIAEGLIVECLDDTVKNSNKRKEA